jgi:hypothetical protein
MKRPDVRQRAAGARIVVKRFADRDADGEQNDACGDDGEPERRSRAAAARRVRGHGS